MEIFLDYARRLDLRDKDGQPLVKWSTPEECFEAWKECTRGRPCDYTGLSYDKLRGGSGIQWPCNDEAPDGTERLYEDLTFPTFARDLRGLRPRRPDRRDVLGGRVQGARPAGARDPEGGGVDAAARVGRRGIPVRARRPAAPSTTSTPARRPGVRRSCRPPRRTPGSSCAPKDAERLGISEGDLLRVSSPRGSVEAPARIGGPREGVVFIPFHYGYWDVGDDAGPDGRPRAANELTMTIWDPVSKQPQLKTAAVKVEKVAMKIGPLLAAPATSSRPRCAAELRAAAERHRDDHDVYHQCHTFAVTADKRRGSSLRSPSGTAARPAGRARVGDGSDDLLEDLRMLYLAHAGERDHLGDGRAGGKGRARPELLALATECQAETEPQAKWFMTRIKTGAPQALVVG